jgi:hypothetical protein
LHILYVLQWRIKRLGGKPPFFDKNLKMMSTKLKIWHPKWLKYLSFTCGSPLYLPLSLILFKTKFEVKYSKYLIYMYCMFVIYNSYMRN